MQTISKKIQESITPAQALDLLRQGNFRFVHNLKLRRNLLEQVQATKEGQHPFAVILSCMDSRTSTELIFDQGLGDIFSIRIAGNVLNEDILGSMEFACRVAGAKIILVMGHTKCGAIKGACDHVEMGNLTPLLEKIGPALRKAPITTYEPHKSYSFIDTVAAYNVHHVMDEIPLASSILADMVKNGEIAIAGGMYNLENGRVEFYEHPHLSQPEEVVMNSRMS